MFMIYDKRSCNTNNNKSKDAFYTRKLIFYGNNFYEMEATLWDWY